MLHRHSIWILSTLIALVLGGLIIIQLYWISNAVSLREEHFEQSVNEALNNVVYKLQKTNAAARITKKLNFRKQGKRWLMEQDSLSSKGRFAGTSGKGDTKEYRLQGDNYRVKVLEEFSSDSNGVLVKKTRERDYIQHDTSRTEDLNFDVSLLSKSPALPDTVELNEQWLEHHTDIVSDIFDELVSINIYNDHKANTDTLLIDSLIKAELDNKGIHADYLFGVIDGNSKSTRANSGLLQRSPYKVNLSPDNVFIQPQFLALYFPGQKNYILRKMFMMLAGSVLAILSLILLFYYTISLMLKQKRLAAIKNDFIGNMTHEFKTPISTISLACEVLADASVEKSPEKADNYVRIIRDENKRLSLLVENILQTAIIDKGEFKLKKQETDLHDIIRQTIANVQLQVEKREGKIILHTQAQQHIISADKVHITNIIYNLFDNALKYTEGQPIIEVETRNEGDSILLIVKDNGMGISRENHKKIFETLYRVPTGNVHNVKGYGLGLSYVKAVAERHGGAVWVESEPGHGSIFYVSLPLNDKDNG